MRILITGASGFIGSHLTQALLDQDHQVLACMHRPALTCKREGSFKFIKANFATEHTINDWLPEYWLHPFGAISKNIPLLIASLMMLIMQERK